MKIKKLFLSLFFKRGLFSAVAVCSLLTAVCVVGGANAAVTIRPIGGVSSTLGAGSSGTRTSGSAPLPTRTSGTPLRVGGGGLSGTTVARGASAPRNSIGKYLNSSTSALRPGSSIKIPTTITGGGDIDLSNYVTQDQYDYLENIVNNLDIEADLSNYYTIPETDGLLDLKQDALTSANAGAGIEIIDGVISMTGDVAPGKDGREVVLRNTGDYIQWQYYGDATWNNLVALDDLAGADGRDVDMRVVGNVVQWQLAGDATWKNLLDLSTLPGGMEIAGTPGNLMMFDETDGTGIEDTGIAADKILVMPDADDLNRGDGDYTIVVSKAGGDVSGPAYMKVY